MTVSAGVDAGRANNGGSQGPCRRPLTVNEVRFWPKADIGYRLAFTLVRRYGTFGKNEKCRVGHVRDFSNHPAVCIAGHRWRGVLFRRDVATSRLAKDRRYHPSRTDHMGLCCPDVCLYSLALI